MKVAFASEHPNHISAFSGTPCYMFQALHEASECLTYIETPGYELENLYDWHKGMNYLQRAGNYLSCQLEKLDVDVVVCQGSSMIPFLKTNKPVVLWHDAIWSGLMQVDFAEFRNKYPFLHEWDRMVLERCDLLFFAADWVREQAINHYDLPYNKVHTLPFGANVLPQPVETVKARIRDRRQDQCELTFLGVDWIGKQLHLAYEVVRRLNDSGLSARLNVIGCHVPPVTMKQRMKHFAGYQRFSDLDGFRLLYHKDPNVNEIGFLRKDEPEQYQRLCGVLESTHFLLHPASFECFGIAVVEATALGVPVIGTNVYGLKTTIRNGVNGYLFEADEYAERATACIRQHMARYDRYQSLALNSFVEQQERLSWNRSVQRLFEILSMDRLSAPA